MNDDKTIEYYQLRAGEYDEVYTRDNPGRQDELTALYDLSQDCLSGCDVLDLACGTGFWTSLVSQTATSMVGIDINSKTLTQAKQKAYNCPVQFIQSDIFDFPAMSRKFTGLMATFLVSHIRRQDLSRLQIIIKESLVPGSPIFLCDNNLVCEIEPELVWDDDHINSYKKRRLKNGDEYLILKNYVEQRELESIFSRWGRVEKVVFDKYYWAFGLTQI